jgi:Flp pilus assembly pilin Flp
MTVQRDEGCGADAPCMRQGPAALIYFLDQARKYLQVLFQGLLRDSRAATSLEYCFIAFLISIAAVTATTRIGEQTLANTSSILTGFSR